MTNQDAYTWLSTNNCHWDRKSSNEIIVWTSGYKCAEHYEIAEVLACAKMRMISEDFDKYCGKTKAVYKHQPKQADEV